MRQPLDTRILGKIVEIGSSLMKIRLAGIDKKFFDGDARKVFKFIDDYDKKYNNVPSYEVVVDETGVELPKTVKADLDYLIDELLNRQLFRSLKEDLGKAAHQLEKKKPRKALEVIEAATRRARKTEIMRSGITNLLKLGIDVLDEYHAAKKGIVGVPTPWETLNVYTLGWRAEDLVIFASRPGRGKTTALLLSAKIAWENNAKVLLVTTEMSKIRLAARFYALIMKKPYQLVRRGLLSDFEEKEFVKGVMKIAKSDERPLYVMGDVYKADVNVIDAAVEKIKPDIVFVDGLYLVRSVGESRYDIVTNVADELKQMGKKWQIPVAASTQFNRNVKKNDLFAELGDIAFSDNIGMVADLVFGLFQNDDMRQLKQVKILPMKLREIEPLDGILCNWNYDRMDFTEIEVKFGDEGVL